MTQTVILLDPVMLFYPESRSGAIVPRICVSMKVIQKVPIHHTRRDGGGLLIVAPVVKAAEACFAWVTARSFRKWIWGYLAAG